MKFFYILPFVAAVFAAVLSTVQAGGLDSKKDLIPCLHDDIACLAKSTENFLAATYNGIPEMDIVAIDPLRVRLADRTVTVKGLKDQVLTDYKMDLQARSVSFSTLADLTIDGDVTAVDASGKRVSGRSSSRGTGVLVSSSYSYELGRDSEGVEHFYLGEETVSCEIVDAPTVRFSANLERPHSSDAVLARSSRSRPEEDFCSVVRKAFRSVVHNIRAAAKVLPASAFIKDLH